MTTEKISQIELVKNHLIKHGYITDLVARNYGVTRLAARIYDIERTVGRSGRVINRETRRDDTGKRYTYYTLAA